MKAPTQIGTIISGTRGAAIYEAGIKIGRAAALEELRAGGAELPTQKASFHVMYFRNDKSMRNTEFQEEADFSEGSHRLFTEKQLLDYGDRRAAAERERERCAGWSAIQVCTWIGNQLMHSPSMFERGEVCKFVRSLGRNEQLTKHFSPVPETKP